VECKACGTHYTKPFWRCAACGRLNLGRWAWWAGITLSPWIYLALVVFRKQAGYLFGFSNELSGYDSWDWLGCFFPLAGVPFLWFTPGGWMKKLGLSLAYLLIYYGLCVVLVIIGVFFIINFHGRG
jgi:hypothetical protein